MRSRPSTIEEEVLKILATVWRGQLPDRTRLLPNYPNPFNPETWIPFQLAEKAEIKIEVYNIHGQRIRILKLGEKKPGLYLTQSQAAYWDGRNGGGEKVSSGVYFYRLIATADDSQQQQSTTNSMVLIK